MAEQTADEEVEAVAEGEATGTKRDRKKLIFIGVGGFLILLLACGGYLYYNGTIPRLLGHKAEKAPPPPKPLVFFDLPDFLVNLNSSGRKPSFLKLTVSLQIEKQEDSLKIQAVLPRIIDNCQIFLRELRVEDLRGSAGIYRLREEMLRRINAVSPVKVDDVLFKEMLVQ
ncbi:MAG TPA: flagellar basal body-associated FliL family protein [Stellaceae bacterium]|nr:flagellar basal body-associated FliL family protein [Stellaceae bacterium]